MRKHSELYTNKCVPHTKLSIPFETDGGSVEVAYQLFKTINQRLDVAVRAEVLLLGHIFLIAIARRSDSNIYTPD